MLEKFSNILLQPFRTETILEKMTQLDTYSKIVFFRHFHSFICWRKPLESKQKGKYLLTQVSMFEKQLDNNLKAVNILKAWITHLNKVLNRF